MERLRRLQSLARPAESKILMLVLDGVGDVPHPDHGGKTALEAARTPNLDRFAARSAAGRTVPFGLGVAPGSGPGHLALFGYPNDAIVLNRGVLEVLGASRAYRDGPSAPACWTPRATLRRCRPNRFQSPSARARRTSP